MLRAFSALQAGPEHRTAVSRVVLGAGRDAQWIVERRALQAPPGTTTLALLHNPDGKDQIADHSWHLALCGHTHGGQLCLPWWGTPFAPVRDHRYVAGLNRWRDRWIYTTRGVGNLHGVRFNCRPEVRLLTLT